MNAEEKDALLHGIIDILSHKGFTREDNNKWNSPDGKVTVTVDQTKVRVSMTRLSMDYMSILWELKPELKRAGLNFEEHHGGKPSAEWWAECSFS